MPEKQYDHQQIELKWQERWNNSTVFQAEENSTKPKFYVLEMLPYRERHAATSVTSSATTPSVTR